MEVLFGEIQCHPAAISGFFLLVVKIHEPMVCWTHGPGSTNSFGSQVHNASMKALCWYRLFPMETSRGEVRAGNPTKVGLRSSCSYTLPDGSMQHGQGTEIFAWRVAGIIMKPPIFNSCQPIWIILECLSWVSIWIFLSQNLCTKS